MAYQAKAVSGKGEVCVYNIGKGEGFVIVGNDEEEDVLGYSDTGTFDAQRLPDNLRAWLQLCADDIEESTDGTENINTTDAPARPLKAKTVTKHPTDVIEPLITTKWGQWEPFNSQCPYIGNTQCPTGCTATALAQVLRYHQHNAGSLAIPAYKTRTTNLNVPALPATNFDWDKMPDLIDTDSDQESIDEVAKLMRYCGQATSMNYNTTGSGAYTYYIPDRLPLYFGFPNTIHYEYREAYDEAEWEALLVAELKNHQPVIYTAYTNLNQGHTFVCDGYDGNGFYHINWGWVGAGNGYYRIAAAHAKGEGLNPNIKNYHLSGSQTALVGIKPTGTDTYNAPAEQLRAYSRPSLKAGRTYTRKDTGSAFEGITLTQSFFNTTDAAKSFYYGYGLYDDTGSLITTIKTTSARFTVGEAKALEAASIAIGAGTTKGHFTIRAIYRTSTLDDWAPMGGTDNNHVDVSIDGNTMTLTPVPQADFTVEHIGMEGQYLQIDYSNPYTEFYGNVYLRKYDAATKAIVDVSSDILVASPLSADRYELYIPETQDFDPGTDRFYLSVDAYNSQYFYTNEPTDTFDIDKEVEIYNLSDDSTAIVGDRIMCQVSLRNKGKADFHDTVVMSLADNRGYLTEAWRDTIDIAAGDTIVRYLEIPLADFDITYFLRMAHHNGAYAWTTDTIGSYEAIKGGIYWTKDGTIRTKEAARNFEVPEEALAIILTNAYTSNVIANSNPNTIYMLDKTLPKGLVGKNYINASNKGNKLTLTDGYDYFFPRQMLFSGKVTYTRTLSDNDSLAWSTLALPFSPTEIHAGDETIAWKQAADDEAPLWMMAISDIQDSIIVTGYAETIEANTPYLLAHDQRLTGKTLTFATTGFLFEPMADMPATTVGDYDLHRTSARDSVCAYTLVGNRMVAQADSVEVEPFRVFLTTDSTSRPSRLHIDIDFTPDTIPEGLKGDADNDGKVDVVDVMLIVNVILGKQPDVFFKELADMNADGIIDVTDAMAIIQVILGIDATPDNGGGNGADTGNGEEQNHNP